MKKRSKVLLLYISEHSGHHSASMAIEKALKSISPDIETLNINSFNYTNPILEKVINRAYMGVIKRRPEIWDYLYDNPKVLRRTQRLREIIHKFNSGKLETLLGDFKPDAVICTQAFPCGMIADYKRSYNLRIPLVGVLTDYAPHSYWIYNNVDRYIVPSETTGRRLAENGVAANRIMPFGIPIDPKFKNQLDRARICRMLSLKSDLPCVLVMGGMQGLGPIREMVRLLDRSYMGFQMIIVTGTNKKLYKWLKSRRFKKNVLVLPQVDNIAELMHVSNVIITKPGGITTAEALAKGLPMLIVNPLPGQEVINTKFLLDEGVAVKAESPQDVLILLEELLYNEDKIKAMTSNALSHAKPDSAMNIAKMTMELIRS